MGALLGPIFLVNPTMGNLVGLKAFAIVILGGLGNIAGATIGGFVLALVEEFGAGYLSSIVFAIVNLPSYGNKRQTERQFVARSQLRVRS